MKNFLVSSLAVLLSITIFSNINAKGVSGGTEFQINTNTASNQQNPSVATFSNNNFVVAWDSNAQDGNSTGVFGQIFSTFGTIANKVGNEFQINTYTTLAQEFPSVTVLKDGNFVVVWASKGQDNGDGAYGTYGQLFDASKNKVGGEFQINTYTVSNQRYPCVTALQNGTFVVVWDSQQDGDAQGIYGQIFDETGSKVGSEFQVNSYTTSNQVVPSVAAHSINNFVVTWHSYGEDGDLWGIYGQIFNEAGTKVGGEFQINTYTADSQGASSVAALRYDNFVVVWNSDGQDGDAQGIYGQIFDETGSKVGSEFHINTYTNGSQRDCSVYALSNGNFVVVWRSDGQDGDGWGIYGQLFDASANKVGVEFQVNIYTTNDQGFPSIAALSSNGFVVALESDEQDGDGYGIYGRIFESNAIPTIRSIVKSGKKNTLLNFKATDFADAFYDADGDSMSQIQVTGLPSNGELKLSKSGLITKDQVIATSDLDDLIFNLDQDFVGQTSFGWRGFDGLQYTNNTGKVMIHIKERDPSFWDTRLGNAVYGIGTGAAGTAVGVIGTVVGGITVYVLKKVVDKHIRSPGAGGRSGEGDVELPTTTTTGGGSGSNNV